MFTCWLKLLQFLLATFKRNPVDVWLTVGGFTAGQCVWNGHIKSTARSYKGGQAASTGSDLELSIQIPDGSGGEETLHQQQDTEQKESGGQSVDDILQEVDAAERERDNTKKPHF